LPNFPIHKVETEKPAIDYWCWYLSHKWTAPCRSTQDKTWSSVGNVACKLNISILPKISHDIISWINLTNGFNFSNEMFSQNFVGWVLFVVQKTISRKLCILSLKGQGVMLYCLIHLQLFLLEMSISKSLYSHLKFDTKHANNCKV
jgi:hypothetical protein